jgi:hypothetical protein
VYSGKTPDDGQRNCPKNVVFHSENKFEKLGHLDDINHSCVYSGKTPDDGQRNCPINVGFNSKINLRN